MSQANLFPREILDSIKKWFDKPEIIVLLGARQVGKSCILKLLMRELEKDEYIYFDLEDTYNLEILSSIDKFLNYIKAQKLNNKSMKVFIDEFQYLPEQAKFLKIIHDHHPQIKLIVSGSSSFEIRKKFTDALTGRKVVFTIYPLSFTEYLLFQQSDYHKIKREIYLNKIIENFKTAEETHAFTPKLVPILEEFIIFGGYPLPSTTYETDGKIIRLKEIYNTYIQKDIKDLAKIENILQFNRLVSFLSIQISGLLNLNEVSKEVGITRQNLEKYIFILENTFVLHLLKPFFTNRQKEITKMPKVFFNDTGLRNININDIRTLDLREDKGSLAENFFFQEIIKRKSLLEEIYYWRTKQQHEVDFVIVENRRPTPIEIKYQKFIEPQVSTSLRAFIEKFNPEKVFIITRDYLNRIRFNGKTEVFFVPLWMV